jgi:hypothetical protein
MERTTCVGSSAPDEILCGITNFVLHRVRRYSKLTPLVYQRTSPSHCRFLRTSRCLATCPIEVRRLNGSPEPTRCRDPSVDCRVTSLRHCPHGSLSRQENADQRVRLPVLAGCVSFRQESERTHSRTPRRKISGRFHRDRTFSRAFRPTGTCQVVYSKVPIFRPVNSDLSSYTWIFFVGTNHPS